MSLTDSIAFTCQALVLLTILAHPAKFKQLIKGKEFLSAKTNLTKTLLRSLPGAAAAGGICFAVMSIPNVNILVKSILGMCIALLLYCVAITPELKLLKKF